MATELDLQLVPHLQVGVRLRYDRHSGRYLLLSPERGLLLNASAAEIISCCDGKSRISELIVELARRGVSEPQARIDICALLSDLSDRGLVGLRATP
jgi:pyrroloquinoline quinone biosynthesis protein D